MVKKLLIGLLVGGTFVSCRQFENPIVEAPNYARFDYRAQSKAFKVITSQGKPYNHKVGYRILGVRDLGLQTFNFQTEKVDTLPNGDLRIAYDWFSFTLTENKMRIVVEVKQNDTEKKRVATLVTRSDYGRDSPYIRITQLPKGAQ